MHGVSGVNPGWIGPLIGLVTLSLAIAFFLLGRRARLKGPTWAARSNNLVRGFASALPDLEILFRSEKVDTLTVTRIAFWNRGMATIDRNDIAPADPLRITSIANSRLLDVKVVQVSGEPSRFEAVLSDNGKAAYLRFDFLDHDHGAVVQVVHTGASGADLTVAGTIKGAGAPVKRRVRGVWLPLPTTADFDRKLGPRTRRRIIRACEVVALSSLVVVVASILVAWLYPSQWAPIREMWSAFKMRRSVLAGALEITGMTLGYLMFFILLRSSLENLGATMLPVCLMSLVDDPLEK